MPIPNPVKTVLDELFDQCKAKGGELTRIDQTIAGKRFCFKLELGPDDVLILRMYRRELQP